MRRLPLLLIACCLCVTSCNKERDNCFRLIAEQHIELIQSTIPYIYAFAQAYGNRDISNDTELNSSYYDIESVEPIFNHCTRCSKSTSPAVTFVEYHISPLRIIRSFEHLIIDNNTCKDINNGRNIDPDACEIAAELGVIHKLFKLRHKNYACKIIGDSCPDVCIGKELIYNSPYIDGIRADMRDPWGTKYRINISDNKQQVIVFSAGPDREYGTSDDILNSRDVTLVISQGQEIKRKITPYFNDWEMKLKQMDEEFNKYREKERCHLSSWRVTTISPPTLTQNGYFEIYYIDDEGDSHTLTIDASNIACTKLHTHVFQIADHKDASSSINTMSRIINDCVNELINNRRYENSIISIKKLQNTANNCEGKWF